MNSTAAYFMNVAITAAAKVFSTTPNPRVGCVIVKNGEIVGTGWHAKPGHPHAEVNALLDAGDAARGAIAYVSLEPCCHHGKTPPCTEALIAAGVAEVVYGMLDPNPVVAGKGIQALSDAGIRVSGPLMEDESRALNRGFIKRMTEGLPYVRCKIAMSLDGRTAMASGESQWITGPAARADVQRLRASACAVMTGVNTVLIDNPSLNVRPEQWTASHSGADLTPDQVHEIAGRQPLRVILDSALRTPPAAKLLSLPGDTLVLTCSPHGQQSERFVGSGASVREVATEQGGRVDLRAAMQCLADQYGCNEVLLESGPTLSGAMIKAGLVDEVIIYIGAMFLGSDAQPLLNLPGLRHMSDRVRLDIIEVCMLDGDCRITARIIHH